MVLEIVCVMMCKGTLEGVCERVFGSRVGCVSGC